MSEELSRDLEREFEELKRKQAKELEEFERQRRERLGSFEAQEQGALRRFEEKESAEVENLIDDAKRDFVIKIDRADYVVHQRFLTGSDLRHLPIPPIGPDRDLFEVVPGGSDKKISDTEKVKMRDGLRFFTAPAQINPGSVG